MITWFWHQIVSSSFCCDEFNISMFSHISHGFSKNCIIHQLKRSFSNSFFIFLIRSVFISIYNSNQVFCLNLQIQWNLFKTSPWFNSCFKFLMCITYSVFWLFQSSSSQEKIVNHCEDYETFQDIVH